jgi:hypothetical protein
MPISITAITSRAGTTTVAVAEIMPQYPGGIQALGAFSKKKNIYSPSSLEAGEEVTVKIEFAVNYDGNLQEF